MDSGRILRDGVCRVQAATSQGRSQSKRSKGLGLGLFRSDWKQRYCLLSECASECASEAGVVLAVYKAKKQLLASERRTSPMCHLLRLDATCTVAVAGAGAATEGGEGSAGSGFVFHLQAKDSMISFSCETEILRDAWVSTIRSVIEAPPPPSSSAGLLAHDKVDVDSENTDEVADEPISVAGQVTDGTTPQPLSMNNSDGERMQPRREESLPAPASSAGLQLPQPDDKPKPKTNFMLKPNNRSVLSANQQGDGVCDNVTASATWNSAKERIVDFDGGDAHGRAVLRPCEIPLPPKPNFSHSHPLHIPGDTTGELNTGNVNDDIPMWMNLRNIIREDGETGLKSLAEVGHEAHELFFESSGSRKQNHIGAPYSVFDYDSLISERDSGSLYPPHLDRRKSLDKMVLEVNDNASSLADSNTDSPGNVTQCVKESGYGDIDQQLSADDRIALLKREVKAVVGMNNELLAEMETMESKHAQAFDQERKRVNSLQCEMRQLSLSNEQFADRNNHLTEKIKEMSEEMRELDLQCQEKDRLCLKTQCDLETLSNYKKLTESLTRDNTDLLCELDKIQVFVQNGKINDDSSSKEKKVLLDQLRNYDDRHKKLTAQMHDVESANSDLLRKNEKLEAELASIVVNMQVCELESKHLRSRVHCEVLEEVCQESVKNCALDAENSEYKGVVLQLNEEISDLKCERSRLLKETREQSILIEQLTSEENAERLQSLSKELRDMLVERDQYKARLSEKHDCLLATESKLIDEQKKTFILSSTLKELQDEVDRKKSMVDSTKNELTYQIDSLTRQSAKLTTERDELATLCAAQTAKLREVDEEAKKEYAIRRQERKSSNKTLLELEDACNRELILTRKYEMAHDEFTRERENLINKIDKQTSISTMLHTKVSDLEEQLHDSKTEILSLQRTKKSLMDETIILQGDIESLKASFATKVKESSDKIKALEQDIDIYKTKLQDTQYQMKESRSKYKANTIELNTSLQGADERCKIISDEVNKLQLLRNREKEDASQKLESVQTKLIALSSQLEVTRNELQMKSTELKAAMEENIIFRRMSENKTILDKNLVEVQLKLNQTEVELTSTKDKLHYIEDSAKESAARFQKRDSDCLQLEETCRELNSTVSDLEHSLHSELKARDKLKSENDDLLLRIEEISVASRSLESQLQAVTAAHDDAISDLSKAAAKVASKDEENLALCSTVDTLRESLSVSEDNITNISKLKDELEENITLLMGRCDKIAIYEAKMKSDDDIIAVMQSENASLNNNIHDLEKLRESYEQKIVAQESISKNKIEELENKISSLVVRNQEVSEENQRYRGHVSELTTKVELSEIKFNKKIDVLEKTLDMKTSDLASAFQVVVSTIDSILDKKGWSHQVDKDSDCETVKNDSENIIRVNFSFDSSSLSSQCQILKEIVVKLRASYCRCVEFSHESRKLMKSSSLETLKKLESIWPRVSSTRRHCIEKFRDSIMKNNECDDADGILNRDDGVREMDQQMSDMFMLINNFCNEASHRNCIIDCLCQEVMCLQQDLDTSKTNVQSLKATAYASERSASRCVREKNNMEKILRTKMLPQEYFEFVRESKMDIDEEIESARAYDGNGFFTEQPAHSSGKYSFDDDGQQDDDCSSSVSWSSRGFAPQFIPEESRPARSSRGARVCVSSLQRRREGGLLADIMFTVDDELEF